MSSTKLTHFDNRCFWVYDTVQDVFLKFLIDAALAYDPTGSTWLAEEIESWRISACVTDIPIGLNEAWTAEQRQTICRLVEDACGRLPDKDCIPVEEIVQWPIHEEMRISPRGDIPTRSLIQFGLALTQLLTGTLPEAPEGTRWYFGTDDLPGTIVMRPLSNAKRKKKPWWKFFW